MGDPAPILPAELCPDVPIDELRLEALRVGIATEAMTAAVEPKEIAATVAMAAADDEPIEASMIPASAGSWRIRSDAEAEWAMRHYAAAVANAAALEDQRRAYVERIESWSKDAQRSVASDLAFFGTHLQAWALRTRAESDGRTKTVKLPSGEIATTGGTAPTVVVVDRAAVIAWAEDALPVDAVDAVVKVEKSVLVSGLRKVVSIAEHTTGRYWMRLSCGCEIGSDDDPGVSLIGLEFDCENYPDHVGATVDAVTPECELCVVDGDGCPVPGAGLEAPSVTAKVKPFLG